MFLIEALIAILIFSLGILSLVAIQTAAMSAQNDAQYRVEAANFANQMMSQIWLNVARNSGTVEYNFPRGIRASGNRCGLKLRLLGRRDCAAVHALVTAWVHVDHPGRNRIARFDLGHAADRHRHHFYRLQQGDRNGMLAVTLGRRPASPHPGQLHQLRPGMRFPFTAFTLGNAPGEATAGLQPA